MLANRHSGAAPSASKYSREGNLGLQVSRNGLTESTGILTFRVLDVEQRFRNAVEQAAETVSDDKNECREDSLRRLRLFKRGVSTI